MVLNNRKIKILEAIINDYIITAEPIGSRTIAKKYDLGISSATIRNEMSDLEDMGFIIQPHASSGRVPSDKGYRLYVDSLIKFRDLTQEETSYLQKMITSNMSQIDYLMQETAKALAVLTNCATIITEPQTKRTKIKYVQLVPVDESSIVLVTVTDTKVVKNNIININISPDMETLNKLSNILNTYLKGCSYDEINNELLSKVLAQVGDDLFLKEILANVIKNAALTIKDEDNIRFYTSGVKNILGYKEFNDIEKAKAIFQTLEEKDVLITLFDRELSENVQVVIGSENNLEQMKDLSIIKSSYSFNDQAQGSIGIIGPTRMDYTQAVSILNGIVKNINQVLKALSGTGG